ncbi:hypothetical protein [Nocardia abscessus]|uniref:hypothetical protein n=1 Tax=Nocardia abscessus TaxID=120957 RepID=UPI0024553CE1|nr:hypothetical protein [Nocardia abscessus]
MTSSGGTITGLRRGEALPAGPGGVQALIGALELRDITFANSWATQTAQSDDHRGLR